MTDLTKSILLPKHRDVGMTLIEDEDFVKLMLKGTVKATWPAMSRGITIEFIRHEADQQLEMMKAVSFEKEG